MNVFQILCQGKAGSNRSLTSYLQILVTTSTSWAAFKVFRICVKRPNQALDEELDMRYCTDHFKLTASTLLSSHELSRDESGTEELTNIFKKFGNIQTAFDLAKAIVSQRSSMSFNTMRDLKTLIYKYNPSQTESTKFQTLIKASQALRIVVNDEIDNIKKLFEEVSVLSRGNKSGLAMMIGFHELEHKAIEAGRRSMRQKFKIEDYYKSQPPSAQEVETNSPSRSARLYAWEFKPKGEESGKEDNEHKYILKNKLYGIK